MKKFECSMQKKKERLGKKNEMKVIPEIEALFDKKENGHSSIYTTLVECGEQFGPVFKSEDSEDGFTYASVLVDIDGTNYDVTVYPFSDNSLSYSIRNEYGTNLKDYVSATRGAPLGYAKSYTVDKESDMWLELQKDLGSLMEDDADESKKYACSMNKKKESLQKERVDFAKKEDLIRAFNAMKDAWLDIVGSCSDYRFRKLYGVDDWFNVACWDYKNTECEESIGDLYGECFAGSFDELPMIEFCDSMVSYLNKLEEK